MVRVWQLPNTLSNHARGRRQREVSASSTGEDVVMNKQQREGVSWKRADPVAQQGGEMWSHRRT